MGQIKKHSSDSRLIPNIHNRRFSEADLDREVDASLSMNSKETYRIGLLAFVLFRNEYSYNIIWPPVLSHVTTFIA